MGSSPSKKTITSKQAEDGTPEYLATDAAGIDMLATYAAKAAMDEHKERLKVHPEIEELLPRFKITVQKIEEASNKCITDEIMHDITETIEDNIEQGMYAYGSKEQRRLMCDQLGYDGYVQASLKYCKAIQKDGPLERSPETTSATMTLLNCSTSMTDRSEIVCQISKQGLIELLLTELKRTEMLEQYLTNAVIYRLVLIYLGLVYNCAKGGVSRQFFNDHGAVDIIMPYTKAKDNSTKALAVMAIAYILEEGEQNEIIVADDSMIHYVLATFSEALDTSDKVSLEGFSVEELAQGLSTLANHDKNKQIIVKHKALQLLVRLMKEGDDKETYWATRCLWTLAFDDVNKEKIKKEPDAMITLDKLKSHESQEVRHAAEGALWVIQGEQEHIRVTQTKERVVGESHSDSNQKISGHVMISYQWDVQKLMIKVKEQLLKNGYRVWLDLDEMGGSTLQAMADAVEKASVVLVCVSQKYKDSPNCRVEAEYAFQQRKEIIPLLVEENYKPTGWLGAIIGTKFYINFAKKTNPFGVCVQQLMKGLGNTGKANTVNKGNVTDVGALPPLSVADTGRPSTSHSVFEWTNKEVQEWLTNNEIQCKALKQLVGEDIMFLVHMRAEAPEFFYNYTLNNLGLKSIPEMRRLRNALTNLT